MATIPTTEPESIRAGDTWRWTRELSDYPAGTWTLKYRFRNASAGFEITAGADGTTHSVSVAASTTTGYAAGGYNWIAWVESGDDKFTVAEGVTQVLADFRATAATAALDARTHAQKMLAAIEAWIESSDPAVAEYEIMGRRMKFIPIGELMKLRGKYRIEVANEQAAARLARGEQIPRRIQFRI